MSKLVPPSEDFIYTKVRICCPQPSSDPSASLYFPRRWSSLLKYNQTVSLKEMDRVLSKYIQALAKEISSKSHGSSFSPFPWEVSLGLEKGGDENNAELQPLIPKPGRFKIRWFVCKILKVKQCWPFLNRSFEIWLLDFPLQVIIINISQSSIVCYRWHNERLATDANPRENPHVLLLKGVRNKR